MPPEYERQRDAMIAKGTPVKDAKKYAAIAYYKKHGVAVNKAEKKMGSKWYDPKEQGVKKEMDPPRPSQMTLIGTGEKKPPKTSVSDADVKKGPKATPVSVGQAGWTEANKLDYKVSLDAGRSPEEAEARINARRDKAAAVQAMPKTTSKPTSGPAPRASSTSSASYSSSTGRSSALAASGQSKPSMGSSNGTIKTGGIGFKPDTSKPTMPVKPKTETRVAPSKPTAKGNTPSGATGSSKGNTVTSKPIASLTPRLNTKPPADYEAVKKLGMSNTKIISDPRERQRAYIASQVEAREEAKEKAKSTYRPNTSNSKAGFVGPVDTYAAASERYDRAKKAKKKKKK